MKFSHCRMMELAWSKKKKVFCGVLVGDLPPAYLATLDGSQSPNEASGTNVELIHDLVQAVKQGKSIDELIKVNVLADPGIDRLSLSVDDMPELRTIPSLPLKGDGWVIGLGIPPRDWEIYFEAKMNGKDLHIEGSEWFWSVVDVDPQPDADVDERVMITIAPSSQFEKLTDDELGELAGIIVTGELGEWNVSRFVRWIGVSPTRRDSEEWFPMESLRKKFVEKFPDCEYGGWLATSR